MSPQSQENKETLLNISDIAELTGRSIPAVSRWIEIHRPANHATMLKTGRPLFTRAQAEAIKIAISESMKPKVNLQTEE